MHANVIKEKRHTNEILQLFLVKQNNQMNSKTENIHLNALGKHEKKKHIFDKFMTINIERTLVVVGE